VFSRYVKSSALTFRRLSFLDMSMCALVVADRMPFAHARAGCPAPLQIGERGNRFGNGRRSTRTAVRISIQPRSSRTAWTWLCGFAHAQANAHLGFRLRAPQKRSAPEAGAVFMHTFG
jgi:hypothetical protein